MPKQQRPKASPVVPKEYAGKWIAWDRKERTIIASGRTFAEVKRAAEQAGEAKPLLEKVPRADVRFVGSGA